MLNDKCDYCNTPIEVCGETGNDIFLEGWEKSLACLDCCEKYNLVIIWSKDMDNEFKDTENVQKMVKEVIKKV